MRLRFRSWILPPLLLSLSLPAFAQSKSYVRYNQAGYPPEHPIVLSVLAEDDVEGQEFRVEQKDKTLLEGQLPASTLGPGPHTPLTFQTQLDLSQLKEVGEYTLHVPGSEPTSFRIANNPSSFLINAVLRHLRVARSGSDTAQLHPASHLKDAQAILYRIKGDPEEGAWEPDPSGDTVDLLGGWYDAGDYIKFTLTCAHTTYFLLRAYEHNPSIFTKEHSTSELVDVLDEAQFGLDYLMKTFPNKDRFIIQVSTGQDHQMGERLPQDDTRDGEREALSSLSTPHMSLTASALALGARIFDEIQPEKAKAYREQAIALFARMQEDDVLPIAAYEKDQVNEFYRDNSLDDNLALAAAELYLLTEESSYLDFARTNPATPAYWVSWGSLAIFANQRLAAHLSPAQQTARSEMSHFIQNGAGNFWNLPLQYSWASLTNWLGVAVAAGLDAQTEQPTPGSSQLFWDLVDYTLGKNNWGKAFIASPDLPNSANRIYSQIYQLTQEFPLGAVSEGPGDRATHDSLLQYFGELDTSLEKFNTEAAVFYDDEKNFMTQESVITGQALAVFLLALANSSSEGPGVPPPAPEPEVPGPAPLSPQGSGCACSWGAERSASWAPWALTTLLFGAWLRRRRWAQRSHSTH